MVQEKEQRELIVEAASTLFSRFGLQKTTMEDIAKAANKGKSTLYYYFKSKEQVFAEVIENEIRGLQTKISEAILKEDDPQKKFRKFVSTRLNYLTEKSNQYIAIKDEYLQNYAFIENLKTDYSNWEISTIQNIVEYGQEMGVYEIGDPEMISRALFFALKGLEYPWIINLSKNEINNSVNVLVDLLLIGINKS